MGRNDAPLITPDLDGMFGSRRNANRGLGNQTMPLVSHKKFSLAFESHCDFIARMRTRQALCTFFVPYHRKLDEVLAPRDR